MKRLTLRGNANWLCAGLAAVATLLLGASSYAAEFHVSPAGKDSNPGSKDAPFATITKARDAIRVELRKNPNRDFTVWLHGGTYRLARIIHDQ